jgi:hypothetical protein
VPEFHDLEIHEIRENPHDRGQTHITSHHASRAITKRANHSRTDILSDKAQELHHKTEQKLKKFLGTPCFIPYATRSVIICSIK